MTATTDTEAQPPVVDRAELLAGLAVVPRLLEELDVTLTRQHRFTLARFGGNAVCPLPFHVAASSAIDGLKVVLEAYSSALVRTVEETPPGETAARAQWLAARHYHLKNDEAAALARALGDALEAAWLVVDRPEDLMFLGVCQVCRMPLYAAPDATTGSCARCRADFSPPELRDHLLARARYQLHSAAELARLLPWFDDRPVTEAAITKAGQRGTLTRYPVGGRIVFQVGEVIDWHRSRTAAAGE